MNFDSWYHNPTDSQVVRFKPKTVTVMGLNKKEYNLVEGSLVCLKFDTTVTLQIVALNGDTADCYWFKKDGTLSRKVFPICVLEPNVTPKVTP